MLLWPVTETANCLPVSISSFIIRSRIPLLPDFSKAYHCSDIDYILLPILQSSVTIWLISGQWYLTGNVTVIFGITSFNKEAICLTAHWPTTLFHNRFILPQDITFLALRNVFFLQLNKVLKSYWEKKKRPRIPAQLG